MIIIKNINEINWDKRFYILIAVVALLRIIIIHIPEITPQGAYYWNYSRHLALGYFDHPPVTAYTIRFFTTIFGSNIFAVRLVSLFYSTGYLIFLYFLGSKMFNKRIGFFSALAMALTPLNLIGGTFVTVDPALIFFWIGSIYFFYCGVSELSWRKIWITGAFAGLAMLSKYPAIFLFPGFLIYMLFTKNGRKLLKTPHPYVAIIISVIMFLPQIIWNYQNDWASFAFQSSRRAGEVKRFRIDHFIGYLLSQFIVASPFFYLGIWKTLLTNIKNGFTKNSKILFLISFSLPMMLFFSFIALFYWVKINWLAPSYLTAIILFIYLSFKNGNKISKYAKISFIISSILVTILYSILLFPRIPVSGELMTVSGWHELAEKVDSEKSEFSNPDSVFVFAWRYKVPSVLAFYLKGQPETYSGDVIGVPTLQYQFWFNQKQLIGKDAIFIYDNRWKFKDLKKLEDNFEKVEKSFEFSPVQGGKKLTVFYVYKCYNYLPNFKITNAK